MLYVVQTHECRLPGQLKKLRVRPWVSRQHAPPGPMETRLQVAVTCLLWVSPGPVRKGWKTETLSFQ